MYDGPVLDAHIHLWDPRTTPRTVSGVVKALGWNPRLMRAAVRKAVPASTMDFVGRPDHILAPYLPGMWLNETRGQGSWPPATADVRGFVHIQADWQAKHPMENADETRWLETICGTDLKAIVGRADLADARLDAVLDAHVEASPRFTGIRDYLAHGGEDDGLMSFASSPDRTAEHAWRRGYDRLGARGLTFDAWTYAHQLPAFAELAAEHPGTPAVLCHVGSPVGIGGPFAGRGATPAERAELHRRWEADLAAVAASPQVHVKLSGLAMPIIGWGWHHRPAPPGVDEVVDAYGPIVEHALEVFGPSRCMVASNFPMDRVSLTWRTLYDAFDQLTDHLTAQERRGVFCDNAIRFYGIDETSEGR
jgi:L-fuconolactonase